MRAWLVDLCGWATILSWIALSVYFATMGDGESFQRIGALGISSGVFYFILQRHGNPAPYGLHQHNAQLQKQLLQNAKAIGVALANTAILAKAFVAQAEREQRDVAEPFRALSDVALEDIERALQNDTSSFEEEIDDIVSDQEIADWAVSRARRSGEILQAFVVIIGTLQTGFGDSLVNSICARSLAC